MCLELLLFCLLLEIRVSIILRSLITWCWICTAETNRLFKCCIKFLLSVTLYQFWYASGCVLVNEFLTISSKFILFIAVSSIEDRLDNLFNSAT